MIRNGCQFPITHNECCSHIACGKTTKQHVKKNSLFPRVLQLQRLVVPQPVLSCFNPATPETKQAIKPERSFWKLPCTNKNQNSRFGTIFSRCKLQQVSNPMKLELCTRALAWRVCRDANVSLCQHFFAPKRTIKDHASAYLAWSHGPLTCS